MISNISNADYRRLKKIRKYQRLKIGVIGVRYKIVNVINRGFICIADIYAEEL